MNLESVFNLCAIGATLVSFIVSWVLFGNPTTRPWIGMLYFAFGIFVLLSTFGADGLELTVVFWISDPENGQGNVRSSVNLAVLRTLDQAGVEIPFPQRVVHLTSSATAATG